MKCWHYLFFQCPCPSWLFLMWTKKKEKRKKTQKQGVCPTKIKIPQDLCSVFFCFYLLFFAGYMRICPLVTLYFLCLFYFVTMFMSTNFTFFFSPGTCVQGEKRTPGTTIPNWMPKPGVVGVRNKWILMQKEQLFRWPMSGNVLLALCSNGAFSSLAGLFGSRFRYVPLSQNLAIQFLSCNMSKYAQKYR